MLCLQSLSIVSVCLISKLKANLPVLEVDITTQLCMATYLSTYDFPSTVYATYAISHSAKLAAQQGYVNCTNSDPKFHRCRDVEFNENSHMMSTDVVTNCQQ